VASSPSAVATHPPCPPGGERRAYQPRAAEQQVLHTIVREHLETFLHEAAERGEGTGLPRFVEQEFRDFLTCGILTHGFARVRCGSCAFERLVPFSCKGRGFCPSCGGRRMTERAARLVDQVLPRVPVRQWVLSLPHRLRYLLAWNHALCRAVLSIYVRALLGFQRRQARRLGIRNGQVGAITVIQRFGGSLNLNIHFHTLALDGVFTETEPGLVRFHPAPQPTDEEVARLLATIRTRVRWLIERRGLDSQDEGVAPADPLAEESGVLASIASASVLGRIALGSRAGARVRRVGWEPNAPSVTSAGPRRAHLDGFDLYASLPVPADDRARLEQLCRYLLRPPVAQDRLRLTADGRVLLKLKSEWTDGTSHLLFEPLEFLEKLAALTPRPRINLLLYHGVLAPHSRWRGRAVAYEGADPIPPSAGDPAPNQRAPGAPLSPPGKPRYWAWADLMRRAFDIDVLACPRCGGRMRLLATVDNSRVIRQILAHLGLPTEVPQPRSPPARAADLFSDIHA
jgi:hypothetical protein